MPQVDPSLLITRREAARLMSVSQRHLYNLERAGWFTPIRLGHAIRYSRADIAAAITRLAEQAGRPRRPK
jgi:predicted DNA-binding transcriptional regulator AlpA